MDYTDVVRNINQTYWKSLLENDTQARAQAAEVAQQMGFEPEAAETMIKQFSLDPLNEWIAQRSAAS